MRLLGDESGASALVIGLSMTAMLGAAGMAVDAGVWYADRRSVQGAADAAAFSAATDLHAGDTSTGATANAKAVTAQHGYTDGKAGVTVAVNTPPTSGPNTSKSGAVEVIVTKPESLFFSSFFISSASVKARAVAVSTMGYGKYCVVGLDPSTSNSVTAAALSGTVTLNMSHCGIQVNAGGSSALALKGNATVNADYVSVVGNYTVDNNAAINITSGGAITTGASSVADPYGSVSTPTPGTCNGSSGTYQSTATISPGTYCGGISLNSGANVTMQPGVYIIPGNSFTVNGGATLTGTGVTIVLTNDGGGGSYATASINGGSTVTLTAPSTGATAGLAIMQDRNAPSSGTDTFNGGASMAITGAIYMPHQTVKYAGNASDSTECTQIIGFDITFTGDSYLNNNCSGFGVKPIGTTATALVE